MNEPAGKIVEHYPVEQLPADLRRDLRNASHVTLTLVEEPVEAAEPTDGLPKYLSFWGTASHRNTSIAEAVTRIRKLRDEWD